VIDAGTFAQILTLVLSIVAAYFGAKYTGAKTKAEQVAELINEIVIAAKDNAVTEEEFQKIVDAAKVIAGKI